MNQQARRLRDLTTSIPAGTTRDELLREREALCDAIRAGQSLDDLGSPEANNAAWSQVQALCARLDAIDAALKESEDR